MMGWGLFGSILYFWLIRDSDSTSSLLTHGYLGNNRTAQMLLLQAKLRYKRRPLVPMQPPLSKQIKTKLHAKWRDMWHKTPPNILERADSIWKSKQHNYHYLWGSYKSPDPSTYYTQVVGRICSLLCLCKRIRLSSAGLAAIHAHFESNKSRHH